MSATNRLVSAIVEPPATPPAGTILAALAAKGVEITYTLEQQQLVFAAATPLHEQWLHDIIRAKRLLFGVCEEVLGPVPAENPPAPAVAT